MNTLYNDKDLSNILNRIEKLSPSSPRQWGKMNVAQMLAHLNVSMETALGQNKINRIFIGRIIGSMIKLKILGEKPFPKNSPTDKTYIIKDDRNFDEEKVKLKAAIKNFAEGGPSVCTTHAHPFFGKYTPEQWAVFTWKHLDHHLRQFGV